MVRRVPVDFNTVFQKNTDQVLHYYFLKGTASN